MTAQSSLPPPRTSLIGRERELGQLRALLDRDDVRLITITGPGGVGKTRLALAIAEEASAVAVDLAPVRDADQVLPTIARTLGLREGTEPVAQRLIDGLRDRDLLLVLDNLEQVAAAAPALSDLLTACPGLRIVATSRVLLRLRGEHALTVPPLAIPEPGQTLEELAHSDAVRLFVERATAARSEFALTPVNAGAIAELCARLDGLPLAIELAAARSNLLAPAALLDRISDRLRLLTGGPGDAPARHRTLRAAIAWSYDLLIPDEQRLLRCLAVFGGGFTVDAAEMVAGAESGDLIDGLAALADRSLLRPLDAAPGEARFGMLETVREFAREQLDTGGETDLTERRRLAWAVALAEAAATGMAGPERRVWLDRLAADHEHLRAALAWAVASGEARDGWRLAAALASYWEWRGHAGEGRDWLDRLLALPGGADAAPAAGLAAAGRLAFVVGEPAAAIPLLERALALHRTAGDRAGAAAMLNNLGHAHRDLGALPAATACHREVLQIAEATGDRRVSARARAGLGAVAHAAGDLEGATVEYEAALAYERAHGDTAAEADLLNNLGLIAIRRGEVGRARLLLETQLAIAGQLGDRRGEAIALGNLVRVLAMQGEQQRAEESAEAALTRFREAGDRRGVMVTLLALGNLAAARDEQGPAARHFHAALTIAEERGDRLNEAIALWNLAESALRLGDLTGAEPLLARSLTRYRELGSRSDIAQIEIRLAGIALDRSDTGTARSRLIESALPALIALDEPAGTAEALLVAARLAASGGRPRQAARLAGAVDAAGDLPEWLRGPLAALTSALATRLGSSVFSAENEAGRTRTRADALNDALTAGGPPEPALPSPPVSHPYGLTARELEVLRLIAEGLPDREIADALFVSQRTVNGHVTNLLNKLGVSSRAAAVALAVRSGIIS